MSFGGQRSFSYLSRNRSAPISVAQVAALIFLWLTVAGSSIVESLVTTSVILILASWGLILVSLFGKPLLSTGDLGLWLVGPSLGLGSLTLLILRSFVSEDAFVIAFFAVPVAFVFRNFNRRQFERSWKSVLSVFSHFELSELLRMSLLVGVLLLTLSRLVNGWGWTFPIVGALGLAMLLLGNLVRKRTWFSRMLAVVLPASVATITVSGRSPTWWRVAEGIPFDETILESISNGLVIWGPETNPLHHELGGASAFAYHHLLYLIVGLVNRFADPEPFRALLVTAPIVISVGIVSTVLLIVKQLVADVKRRGFAALFLLMSILTTLFALDTDGSMGPSSWFGTLSLLGSILFLLHLLGGNLSLGNPWLFSASIAAVAFSKGTFVWMPVALAVALAAFDWRARWRLAVVAITSGLVLTYFFRSSNVLAQTYSLSFWPRNAMASEFDLSLYSVKVFVDVLVNPLILGVPCLVLLIMARDEVKRQLSVALLVVMSLAIGSRLFLDSNGPGATDLFYSPGITASALAMLLLVRFVDFIASLRRTHVTMIVFSALAIVLGNEQFDKEVISSYFVGATVVLVIVFGVGLRLRARPSSNQAFRQRVLAGCAFFTITLFTCQSLWDFYREIPGRIQQSTVARYEDWYGSSQFRELKTFVQASTPTSSLFAYSIKQGDSLDDYEIDYRPAALLKRRFLALHPQFDRADVSPQLWSDVEASRQIGVVPAQKSIDYLAKRGVSYLLVDRSQIYPEWLQDAQDSGAVVEFDTSELVLLKLGV